MSRILQCFSNTHHQYRWLHVRLFLFRPALLAVLDQDQSPFASSPNPEVGPGMSLLRRKILSTLADLCIQAAEDSVNLIHENSVTKMSALSAWWYNVFCGQIRLHG